MTTQYWVVTAVNITGRSADQPSAERVIGAFLTVFNPTKGFSIIGGIPRITRQVHADPRPPSSVQHGIGMVQLGLGILAVPFTMGFSLASVVGQQAVSAAVSGAVNAYVTTTATAVVATDFDGAAAQQKIQQEFANVLGPGWGSVVIAPFDPAVNGPFAGWYDGTVQRSSATTAPQTLVALATQTRENPIGPTPPGLRLPGAGVINDAVADATAIGATAVAGITAGFRAGVANVTGAAGDGLRNISQAAADAAAAANRAARDTATTLAEYAVGAVVVLGGIAFLIGKSTGRSATSVAGDSLMGALSATPIGKAKRIAEAATSNPGDYRNRDGAEVWHGHGVGAVHRAMADGLRLPLAQYTALEPVFKRARSVEVHKRGGLFDVYVRSAGAKFTPAARERLVREGFQIHNDFGREQAFLSDVPAAARNPAAVFGRSSATTSRTIGGRRFGTKFDAAQSVRNLPGGLATDGTVWAAVVDRDGGVSEFLRGGLYGLKPARPSPRELAAAQSASAKLHAAR